MIGEVMCGFDGVRFARERLGFEPDAKQRIVLGPGGRRGLLNCSRQWGKSTVTAAKAVHRAYSCPESLVLVVCPCRRQSGEFLRKAAGFVRKLGIPTRGDGDNECSLVFPNGARIVGLPDVEANVRGFSAVSLLLIDEAARVSDDLYRAILPMLAVGDGDLWLMSTPCGQRGFFYEEWTNGGDEWLRVSVPGAECPRIPAAVLQRQKATLGDRWFRQEFGCEFVGEEGSLFDMDLVRRAMMPDLQAIELEERW